jgi:hypothetical protein
VPLAIFVTGLSLKSSVTFAVGLLAGMVPEGLAVRDHPVARGGGDAAGPAGRGCEALELGRDARLDGRDLH